MRRQHSQLADILGTDRLAGAVSRLRQADAGPQRRYQLTKEERSALRQAVATTSHPLADIALSIIEDWDRLAADDQAAGLLFLAAIARHLRPGRTFDIRCHPNSGFGL